MNIYLQLLKHIGVVIIKAIIPLAGKGTRLRPHTYSKPKPMLHVAGKPVLGHILDSLSTLDIDEIVFITGDMEDQIVEYVSSNYKFKTNYVKQKELLGDGHAINMAQDIVDDDVIVVFVDTLFLRDIKNDIDNIGDSDGIVWTSKTDDPKRFGIVEKEGNIIKDIEEKPEHPKSDLAVIGIYYFKSSKKMFGALDKIREMNITSKGEYRLADAIALMIKDGLKFNPDTVDKWLDCGKPETLLSTNKYLLNNGRTREVETNHSVIKHPVYIEEDVEITDSIIGPYVSIAKGSKIKNSVISKSIIGNNVLIENAVIDKSLIGNEAEIVNTKRRLNVGDSSQILLTQ